MNQNFILKEPNINDEKEIIKYKEEFIKYNSLLNGGAGLLNSSSFLEWLKKIEKDKDLSNSPIKSELLFVRKSDDKILGTVNIRHSLDGIYSKHGGHIGYSIRPTERNKGYGTILLSLALEFCKTLGIKKVLLTCNKDNFASKKVILKNNGKFESEFTENGRTIERYWIEI